jgi:hypothetical protein
MTLWPNRRTSSTPETIARERLAWDKSHNFSSTEDATEAKQHKTIYEPTVNNSRARQFYFVHLVSGSVTAVLVCYRSQFAPEVTHTQRPAELLLRTSVNQLTIENGTVKQI